MQNVLRVHVVNGTGYLLEYSNYIALRKVLFTLPFGYDLSQGAAIGVLHFNHQRIILDKATQITDYVWMMQLREHLYLVHGQVTPWRRKLSQIDLLEDDVMTIEFAPIENCNAKGSLTHNAYLFIIGQLGASYVECLFCNCQLL